jgi:hypothetical protein
VGGRTDRWTKGVVADLVVDWVSESRRALRRAAALACCPLFLAGCIGGGSSDDPRPEPSVTPQAGIGLEDISVSPSALVQRAGLYMCGDRIVASAPAGGIESDSFVVFDPATGRGETTRVRLPRGPRPNARWLLTTRCVSTGGEPLISVAYQEMPLLPTGGAGIRASYTLDGRRLWLRDDLNQPGTVVEHVLVLGSTPEQPETAVDLRTGRTVATFDPAVQSRTLVSAGRMVVRGLSGPPVLTTLTGVRVATLQQASTFTADADLLFGTTPAALPDPGRGEGDEGDSEGLTDASPSPSPTQSSTPSPGSGLFRGEVRAYSLRSGRPLWSLHLAPDPLGLPVVEDETGIVVVVDINGLAHGIDPATGRELWRTPTELENPRVTAAAGMVLFDKADEPFQKLVDARTGLPLPEPQETIVDLQEAGALQVVDGVARIVPPRLLRNPPTATDGPLG